MAETDLSATTGGGTQTTTQNPQTAGSNFGGGTDSSQVQQGTASDLLRSANGIQLKLTPVTTVGLSSTQSQQVAETPKDVRHFHPGLAVFSLILLVVAIMLFRLTNRSDKSVKSTTE